MMWQIMLFVLASGIPSGPGPVQGPETYDPIGDYQKVCLDQTEESLDCVFLRGLVKRAVLEALETIEVSGDQRGTEEALAALELTDEPEIQIAACRILGHFPELSGVRGGVLSLLLSPHPAVQQAAARVLRVNNQDQDASEIGQQWLSNHQGHKDWDPYEESSVPEQPARLGVTNYPGSERFPPGESKQAFAWLTSDSAAKVADFFARQSGKKLLDAAGWATRQEVVMERQQAAAGSYMDRPEIQEIQKLVEQYMVNQDAALLEKIEALQKKLESISESMQELFEDPVTQAANLTSSAAFEGARYLVLEERDGKPLQLLVLYPEPVFKKTVIRFIWDAETYGPAWE